MFYLYIKGKNGVDLYKLQRFCDRTPILRRLSSDTIDWVFIGEGIYQKLELEEKTLEQQYEILADDDFFNFFTNLNRGTK